MREGRTKWERLSTATVMQQVESNVSAVIFQPAFDLRPGDLVLFSRREPGKATHLRPVSATSDRVQAFAPEASSGVRLGAPEEPESADPGTNRRESADGGSCDDSFARARRRAEGGDAA